MKEAKRRRFDATDAVTPDLERKSDETEEVIIKMKEDASDNARSHQAIRPTQEEDPEETFKDDEFLAEFTLNISRPRGVRHFSWSYGISPSTTNSILLIQKKKATDNWLKSPKRRKLHSSTNTTLETAHDEKLLKRSREWDAEEERKRLEDLKKAKPKTILKKPTSLAQELTHMMKIHKSQGYKICKTTVPQMKETSYKREDAKRLLRKRKATVTEEQPSKKLKLRTRQLMSSKTILDCRLEKVHKIESPEDNLDDYIIKGSTHLYLVVQDYYKHIHQTGLGLILLGDLHHFGRPSATSDDILEESRRIGKLIMVWKLKMRVK
ncbi:hypothetical protein Tco_0490247 [Tanacetum coccineum]